MMISLSFLYTETDTAASFLQSEQQEATVQEPARSVELGLVDLIICRFWIHRWTHNRLPRCNRNLVPVISGSFSEAAETAHYHQRLLWASDCRPEQVKGNFWISAKNKHYLQVAPASILRPTETMGDHTRLLEASRPDQSSAVVAFGVWWEPKSTDFNIHGVQNLQHFQEQHTPWIILFIILIL